jgi:predicted hydrolase (HD superfamily)
MLSEKQIFNMTSTEIENHIMKGAEVYEERGVPDEMAMIIWNHPDWKTFDNDFKDWVISAID